MGILDGAISGLFGEVFGTIYLDGVLHMMVRTEGVGGSVSRGYVDHAMKAQHDGLARYSDPAQGNAPLQSVIIMLAQCDGVELPEPFEGCQLTLEGSRYAIGAPIGRDPARSHYRLRVTKTTDASNG